MNILCVYNPRSGKGLAKQSAEQLVRLLSDAGHEVALAESQISSDIQHQEQVRAAELLIVVGGDGTLAKYLALCAANETMLSFLGFGNECLFSQTFQLPRNVEEYCAGFANFKRHKSYFAYAQDTAFFHVLSIGFDAEVVRAVAQWRTGVGRGGVVRKGTVSNATYVRCALQEMYSFRIPHLTLKVDGELVLDSEPGALLCANQDTYAGGISPVPGASFKEPLLRARFYPNLGPLGYIPWGIAYLRKSTIATKGSREFEGLHFEISCEEKSLEQDLPRVAPAVQIDGEFWGLAPLELRSSALSRGPENPEQVVVFAP